MSCMSKTTQSKLGLTVWDKELEFEIKKHIVGWYINKCGQIGFYKSIA